jgi:hypothetical protein
MLSSKVLYVRALAHDNHTSVGAFPRRPLVGALPLLTTPASRVNAMAIAAWIVPRRHAREIWRHQDFSCFVNRFGESDRPFHGSPSATHSAG